jgi:hypothetical protein
LLRRSTIAAAFVVALVASWLPGPALAANVLSNPRVTPPEGTTSTEFTFRIDYSGSAPRRVWVQVASSGQTIELDLAPETGDTFAGSMTLDEGAWSVSFRADSSTQKDPSPVAGPTVVVTAPATPTPDPTPVPTATPTPIPTPPLTIRPPTPRPTPTPTLGPGETPRPPGTTPQPTAATPPGASPVVVGPAGGTILPSATEGTLAGNPTPTLPGEDGNVPAEGSPDPDAEATSDDESAAGVGRVVMLAVGGTLAVSGAGYLTMLALRRRGWLNGGGS